MYAELLSPTGHRWAIGCTIIGEDDVSHGLSLNLLPFLYHLFSLFTLAYLFSDVKGSSECEYLLFGIIAQDNIHLLNFGPRN